MSVQIIVGDCRDMLKTLPDASVQTVVTSPPYYGLRDYGEDDQIGLEETPEAYIAEMVAVFREVRRVLRDDGTVWLNLGDSYASNPASGGQQSSKMTGGEHKKTPQEIDYKRPDGFKPKDLIGIPWRVALALQADGWYLRSDIIWHKPNPMPESVTDRPTKAHEYVFLLTKSARYFYDADAVAEKSESAGESRGGGLKYSDRSKDNGIGGAHNLNRYGVTPATRNRRSVWSIATKPYSGAHFAVMPPDLVEPCIKAGTSERGACPECGAPWERVTEKVGEVKQRGIAPGAVHKKTISDGGNGATSALKTGMVAVRETTHWQPTCDCDAGDPVPCVVLDPFAGAGTVGLVADRLGRDAILIELNADYAEMARRRIVNDAPMFARVEVK